MTSGKNGVDMSTRGVAPEKKGGFQTYLYRTRLSPVRTKACHPIIFLINHNISCYNTVLPKYVTPVLDIQVDNSAVGLGLLEQSTVTANHIILIEHGMAVVDSRLHLRGTTTHANPGGTATM